MAPSPRKPWSIAARLVLTAIACSALLLLIVGVILSSLYRRTSLEAFDRRLGVFVRELVAEVAAPGDDTRTEAGRLGEPQFELALSGWYWQITRLDTEKPDIKASQSLFAEQLPRLAELGVTADSSNTRRGYAEGPDGRTIRIVEREIDAGDDGVFLVQVGATTEEVDYEIRRFDIALTIAFSVLALMLAGATVLQVRIGLRPLRRLGDEVAAIRQGDAERIDGVWSDDLSALASELNLLISSNRDILERARTQVGNLAHALKTPLSVITNEADATGGPLAEKVAEQAALMRDQVSWYLDRARAAARSRAIGAATEIAPAVEGLVRTFGKIHGRRGIDFDFTVGEGVKARCEKRDLEDMLGNLVDNAGKWAKARVDIAMEGPAPADDGRAMIELLIDDDGPGLPAELRAQALARGKRLDESKPGSGLGLAIVSDLAALHGGGLSLDDSPLGGLRARLRLPSV